MSSTLGICTLDQSMGVQKLAKVSATFVSIGLYLKVFPQCLPSSSAFSFGSSMVLLYGYPESPFAQPKNVFFGHLLTAIVGMIFLYLVPLPLYLILPLAVGFGVGLMIFLNVTHPPAGGNPIIVIMGSVSPDYLLNPVISGSIIILGFGIIINRFILKKSYPKSK